MMKAVVNVDSELTSNSVSNDGMDVNLMNAKWKQNVFIYFFKVFMYRDRVK